MAILTGGTRYGVPARASTIAKQMGFHTIVILPVSARSKALGEEILDLRVCVDAIETMRAGEPEFDHRFGSQWGDESAIFAKTSDSVIVLGGRAGTLVEIAHILKINEARRQNRQTPKMIVPISGTGGMADAAPYLPANPDVRRWCMPDTSIASGGAAARLLEDRLSLHDLLSPNQPEPKREGLTHEHSN